MHASPASPVRVSFNIHLDPSGYPMVNLSASLPVAADALRQRESEIGLDRLRTADARRKYADRPSVAKYHLLARQIAEAKAKAAAATKTFERVAAAETLLRDNPTESFAADLRRVAAEREAATTAKVEAETDLQTIQTSAAQAEAKLFVAAANAITSQVRLDVLGIAQTLDPVVKEYRERLDGVCRELEATIAAAIAKHVPSLVLELRAASRCSSAAWADGGTLATETITAVLGPTPAGVGRDRTQYVVQPPAPPTPTDPTAADRAWLAEQERAYAAGQA